MIYTEYRREMLVLKIKVMKSNIINFELALSTYRKIEDIQFGNKGNTLAGTVKDTDRKIVNLVNCIDTSVQTLHSLEIELSVMEEDRQINSYK